MRNIVDLFGPKRKPPSKEDLHLRTFFTNVEVLLKYFTDQLTVPTLTRRILVIHGLGGVGKSTLLVMYRLICADLDIPVALASDSDAIQVLQTIAKNLAAQGVKLRAFNRTLKKYHALQAKVSERLNDQSDALSTTVGALLGMVASAYLGPGAGEGAAAAVDWLKGVVSKSDLELLLDPTKYLTEDFLKGLAPVAARGRVVLMIDHYERMAGIELWVLELARSLPSNVLLVIAGRKPPEAAWDRDWQGWIGLTRIEEVTEMSIENMRTLVGRYYLMMRDSDPDPDQVEKIVKFARGLPLVVTATVDLWVKYGVKDFSTVKPEVEADLVDRLLEGIPPGLRPLLEAAASVRWFNRDVLRAITGKGVGDKRYGDLRNFPFIRPRSEGLGIHDVVREIIDDNLKSQKPSQHKSLHEAAAHYFEARRQNAPNHEKQSLLLEEVYHMLRADEEAGNKVFRQLAEEISHAGAVGQLRTLVWDVRSHSLHDRNRLWVDYYATRISQLEARFQEAETQYRNIAHDALAEDVLKAYSLCDLGSILTRWERLGQGDGPKNAREVLNSALKYVPLDLHLSGALFDLARAHEYTGDFDQGRASIQQAYQFFEGKRDSLGMVFALNSLLAAHVLQGNWRDMLATQKASLDHLSALPEYPYLKAKTAGYWSWGLPMAGRCAEAEASLSESVRFMRQVEETVTLPTYLRNLGLSLGMQKRYGEGYAFIEESLDLAKELGNEFIENRATSQAVLGMLLVREGNYSKARECLSESLRVKLEVNDNLGISEALVWNGALAQATGDWTGAIDFFQQSLEWRWTGRRYYESAALVGLCRSTYYSSNTDSLEALIREADQLGLDNDYYDHLASLRQIEGNLAWDGESKSRGKNFEQAHNLYLQALVCALRYNRFLLDDTLDGIVAHCRQRGKEGQRMMRSLSRSWKSGRNDVNGARPSSVSPLPAGASLLKAESLARARELGDGVEHESLVQTLERSLS